MVGQSNAYFSYSSSLWLGLGLKVKNHKFSVKRFKNDKSELKILKYIYKLTTPFNFKSNYKQLYKTFKNDLICNLMHHSN